MTNNKVVGIGYVRVSTKKQADEGVSLDIQKRDVTKKLNELGCIEVLLFEDYGKSGKSIKGRDGFQEALEKATKLKAKYFCTYDTSRFARNTEEAIQTVKYLRDSNIELVCVTKKFDDTPEGKLVFSMLATIDQFYSDSLGAKISKSMRKLTSQGYYPHKAPKGYDNIRIGSKADIILNEDGRAIQKTFQNYLAGRVETFLEVATDLDKNGFEKGRGTSFQTAGRILKTPFYAGMFWNKRTGSYIDHKYESIISKENWNFIQDKLEGRRRQTNHYKVHHPDYPLRSVTYCSMCGKKLRGYPAKGNGGIYKVYDCKTKGCFKATNVAVVHREFEKVISNMESDDGLLRLFEEILSRSLSQGMSEDVKKVGRRSKQVQELQSEQQNTINAIAKLNNTEVIKGLEGKYGKLQERIEEIEQDIVNANSIIGKENCELVIEKGQNLLRNPSAIWENASPELKHRYQKWLFPSGIEYHPTTGLRTREKCLTYRLLEALESEDSSLVETVGIEPTSKSVAHCHITSIVYLD